MHFDTDKKYVSHAPYNLSSAPFFEGDEVDEGRFIYLLFSLIKKNFFIDVVRSRTRN